MPDLDEIRSTLVAHDQEHLLAFHDTLAAPQQATLLEQLAAVPWDRLDEWIERFVRQPAPPEVPQQITPPPIVPARPRDDAEAARHEAARQRGRELVAAGKVAAFVVAGGQGTRLGYEGPKGCLEATPVAHKPLFQVFAEQIRAAARREGATIPWYIMTSPTNDVATRAFFREHQFFGLDEADVFFLTQGTLPAISLDGKLLLAGPGQLAVSPDGHGGSLDALRASGALDDMRRRGIEQISYFQVDNPLTHCIDPLFLGMHAEVEAQMSAKAVAKRDPLEKLGNFCMVDGRVRIIEYSDLPEELARATTDDGGGDREFCFAGGRDCGRAGSPDRVCRSARDQADDPIGASRGVPDRGIPCGARVYRQGDRPALAAPGAFPAARVLFGRGTLRR